jgi:hypothetical protein
MKTSRIFILITLSTIILSCASKKHTQYLEKNLESIHLDNSDLQFHSLDSSFYNNKLFFVGEIHEVSTSPKIDVAMFKQLHKKAGVKTYVAEMDMAQGYYLNEYIKGSDELDLKTILKEWVVGIGQNSAEVREKYTKLREFYKNLPESQKFEIVGIEMNTDFELIKKLIINKLNLNEISLDIKDDSLIVWGQKKLPEIIEENKSRLSKIDFELVANIQYNFAKYNPNWYWYRDKYAFQNFKRIYEQRLWKNEKLYACFGFAHTLQAYPYTFAGRIKKDQEIMLADKMVSLNALYVDSYLTVTSKGLPKFMRSKEKFTRLKLSYDNYLFMYLKGIKDYKKVTKKNTINLFRLDGENSPYKKSLRGTKNFALIPIWDGFKIEDKNTVTTDYAQYVIFVRNADWVKPD